MPSSLQQSDLTHMFGPDDIAEQTQASAPQFDAGRGLNFRIVDGKKFYEPPGGNPLAGQGGDAGGWLHGHTVWDPEQGKYTNSISWGKVLGWVGMGIVGYGAASAIMASGAASTAATGATAASGGGGAAAALGPSTAANMAATSAVAGGSTVPASLAATGGANSLLGSVAALKSNPYSTGAEALSSVLGNASARGAQEGLANRELESRDEQTRLARDKYALEAPGTRMNQSLKASVLGNFQPRQIHWNGPGSGLRGEIPTYTGGFEGGMANLDPETKELMKRTIHDNLVSQMSGGSGGGGQDYMMQPHSGEGAGGKVLGGVAMGSSLLAGLLKAYAQRGH